MREDDQERKPTDERRYWREAYEPTFGRGSAGAKPLGVTQDPLFYLEDADVRKIHEWLLDETLWGRPIWIAVTALFHNDLPVESRLIQVAVALEALGHAIARHENPHKKPPWSFVSLARVIFEDLGFTPGGVLGEHPRAEAWITAFNDAYKGAKHADHELTEPMVAWDFICQGIALFRCWLAIRLGVDPELVDARLCH